MKSFGLVEAGPRSKKHLNYEILDLRSKRILIRLCQYMQEQEMSFASFTSDIIVKLLVKTKSKVDKVEIIKAEALFKKLKDLGIKTKPEIHYNLC